MIRPKTLRYALPLASLTVIAACAPVEGDDDFVSRAPAAKVVGEAQNCIPLSGVRQSTVHDDRTIDFRAPGGKIYRNTLTRSCPRLGFEEAFTYETSINQLCSTDIIYVLENFGGEIRRGPGCSLGKFVPIEYVEEDEEE
ncbi:hypothetical protein [Altererythrobacter lutimaris]|uniref:Uncharacterized protein n=1 Tax=Altererythrobacter lutimaris TaxID=2743979 RepID=A0A850HIW1_9SPHN|nr:hypothetical protein [Altererythrobacter lutimaris]NVE95782.1 hypothetical protein [Altererythrobacter lutimaris]